MDRARRSLTRRVDDVAEFSSEFRVQAEEVVDGSSAPEICGTEMAATAEGELNKLEASGRGRSCSDDGAVEDTGDAWHPKAGDDTDGIAPFWAQRTAAVMIPLLFSASFLFPCPWS